MNLKELLQKYNINIDTSSIDLQQEIYGRTIKEWLILGVKFSFVIWGGVLGYIAYDFYNQYMPLKKELEAKTRELKTKKNILTRTKIELEDIKKGYNELSKISTQAKQKLIALKNLLRKNMAKKEKSFFEKLSVSSAVPYGYVGINVRVPIGDYLNLVNPKKYIFEKYPIKFTPPIKTTVGKLETLIHRKIYLTVDFSIIKNYFVIFLKPANKTSQADFVVEFNRYKTFAPNIEELGKYVSFYIAPKDEINPLEGKGPAIIYTWELKPTQ